jgi:hypothetical protein
MTRPLWQLLLETNDPEKNVPLTCEECLELLEFDVDLLASGADPEKVHKIVSHHLVLCSSCGTQLDDLLKEFETSLSHPSDE